MGCSSTEQPLVGPGGPSWRQVVYAGLLVALILVAPAPAAGFPLDQAQSRNPARPGAVRGILDLTEWPWDSDKHVDLSGEWEFHWKRLLEPTAFGPDPSQDAQYVRAPAAWNEYETGAGRAGAYGYATYSLLVKTGSDGLQLGLRVPAMSTAYTVWINGRMVLQNGVVGTSPSEMVPQDLPRAVYFTTDSSEIRLVIQVSNFHQRRGGMWQPLQIGSAPAISRLVTRARFLETFCFAMLFATGSYHIFLFASRHKERAAADFGLLCMAWGLRTLLVGEAMLRQIFPGIPWSVCLAMEYVATAIVVPLFYRFGMSLFPNETPAWTTRLSQGIALVFIAAVLVTPSRIHSRLMMGWQVVMLAACVHLGYVLLLAVSRKRHGAIPMVLGALPFVATSINDVLFYVGLSHVGNLSAFGLVVLCSFQSFALSRRYSRTFLDAERMSEKLAELNRELTAANRDLEQNVQERTAALLDSNRSIANANRELARMEKARRDLLTNIAHDLRTPITLIRGYVEALVDGVVETPEEQTQYLELIYDKTTALNAMIEDLFELTQLEAHRATFQLEKVPVLELVSNLYLRYQPDIRMKNLEPQLVLETAIDGVPAECMMVEVDVGRIDRAFANLIYNAIKFTPPGGTITVCLEFDHAGEEAILKVQDSGPGIAEKDIPHIFDRFYKGSRARKTAGSGLGLTIAKEIITYHGGRIWAKNMPRGGSAFAFSLPVQRQSPPA